MPQAAVRIAPSPLAASASLGAEARAVAEAGPRRPGERAGAAPGPATPVSAAEDAPGLRNLAPVMSVDSGFGGPSFLEGQLPKIDWAGRDIAPRADGGVSPETAPRRVPAGTGAPDHAAATAAALRGGA